ncbi:hypothetical protein F5X97DRAFT_327899 [Nemania serpens]|nr:hypothetical protein F5X97DRAFT_327899 [Nemania serpens]
MSGAQNSKSTSWEDRDHFITFCDAPGEWEFPDLAYEHHSCLLGEVIQADTFLRPRLVTDQTEMPRLLKDFKVGYTIAIFYPVSHGFLDGTVGFRVEKTDKVLVIPLGLRNVLAMNEQAIEFVDWNCAPRMSSHRMGHAQEVLYGLEGREREEDAAA